MGDMEDVMAEAGQLLQSPEMAKAMEAAIDMLLGQTVRIAPKVARIARVYYDAYMEAGFSASEALSLTIAATAKKS